MEQTETVNTVIAFDVTDAKLAEYRQLYAEVPDAETKHGMDVIKSTLRDLRSARAGIEATRKAKVSEIMAAKKSFNDEATRLVGELDQIIAPHAAAKKVVDDRKKAEKEERERKEREKIQAIMLKIAGIREKRQQAAGKTPEEMEAILDEVKAIEITEEDFGSHQGLANETWLTTVRGLTEDLARAKADAEMRERLERLEKENAALKAKEAEKAPEAPEPAAEMPTAVETGPVATCKVGVAEDPRDAAITALAEILGDSFTPVIPFMVDAIINHDIPHLTFNPEA